MKLLHGDCLEVLPNLPDNSVDLVLADPPYGTTQCKWDSIIPLEPMWEQLKRVTKKRAAIVLTAGQPFTSALIMSNVKMFKYTWVWDKVTARGHLVAKKRPMAQHEDVCVFYDSAPTYNPQMIKRNHPIKGKEGARTSIMGGTSNGYSKTYTHKYPKTIASIKPDLNTQHPTQKPVALMEYLIKTYTNEGDVVLDFCMGSGTTGVACINLNRDFIGIEREKEYFDIATQRINEAQIKQPETAPLFAEVAS